MVYGVYEDIAYTPFQRIDSFIAAWPDAVNSGIYKSANSTRADLSAITT